MFGYACLPAAVVGFVAVAMSVLGPVAGCSEKPSPVTPAVPDAPAVPAGVGAAGPPLPAPRDGDSGPAKGATARGTTSSAFGSPDRRLTRFELGYAISDVFGVDASSLLALPRPRASIGDVPDILVGPLLDRSEAFRQPYRHEVRTLADTIAVGLVRACGAADSGKLGCLRARLVEPTARLWRTSESRAVDEVEAAARSHATEGPRAMFRAAVEHLLDDERFWVSQLELSHGGTSGLVRRRLASRLALVLWSSVPDLPLLRRAEAGVLEDPVELRAEIARMRRDARFDRFAHELVRQWLRLDRAPLFRPSLAERRLVSEPKRLDAAVEEAARIVRKSLDDRAPVDRLLAARGGLLTSTALLSAISTEIRGGGDESWLGRGLVVQAAFLCRTFPLAAIYPLWLWEDHPLLDPHVVATTKRPAEPALLAMRTRDAPCRGCHRQLETIGAALWMFDGLGRRTSRAAPAHATVAGQPVDGPAELGRWILATGRFDRCAAQKVATYVLSRAVLPLKRSADRKLVDELAGSSIGPAEPGAAEPARARTLGGWLGHLLESEAFRDPGPLVIRDAPTPLAASNDYVDPLPPVAASARACAAFSPGRFLVDGCGSSACHGPGSSTGVFAVADPADAAARMRAAQPRPDGYCSDEAGLVNPARPADSLMIRKVTAGGRVCGAPMPIVDGGPPSFEALDHACFVRWVESVARGD